MTPLNKYFLTAFRSTTSGKRHSETTQLFGRLAGAVPVERLDVSDVGHPRDRFQINGSHYTYRALSKYLQYAYAVQFMDFGRSATIVELGGGGGKQLYVFGKLLPHLSLLNFDLPIQLYCCEQYLKKNFPEDIVSYRETRTWDTIPELRPGKIYVLGSWQFPLLHNFQHDLFVNCASFQEMEPEVVANYLSIVRTGAKNIHLCQNLSGMPPGQQGDLSVLERTTMIDYRQALESYTLVDKSDAYFPLSLILSVDNGHYTNVFWKSEVVEQEWCVSGNGAAV